MSELTHTHDHEHERCQEHEHHDHQHEHHHDHDHGPAHIHSHRNIIGFDENGIPTVILKASHGEGEEDDPQAFIRDYMNAAVSYTHLTLPTTSRV